VEYGKKEGIREVLKVAPDQLHANFAAAGNKVFGCGRAVKDFRREDYEMVAVCDRRICST
jgi:hypothetical protein